MTDDERSQCKNEIDVYVLMLAVSAFYLTESAIGPFDE
jgi:hypothetical protein